MDEVPPRRLIVQRIGRAIGRVLHRREVLAQILLELGPRGVIQWHGPNAGAVKFGKMWFHRIAVPQMQQPLVRRVVHVKAQLELIDPVEPARLRAFRFDRVAIHECAVVTMLRAPAAGFIRITDAPVGRPRHIGPTRERLISPRLVLFHGPEILGRADILFVGIGTGRRCDCGHAEGERSENGGG